VTLKALPRVFTVKPGHYDVIALKDGYLPWSENYDLVVDQTVLVRPVLIEDNSEPPPPPHEIIRTVLPVEISAKISPIETGDGTEYLNGYFYTHSRNTSYVAKVNALNFNDVQVIPVPSRGDSLAVTGGGRLFIGEYRQKSPLWELDPVTLAVIRSFPVNMALSAMTGDENAVYGGSYTIDATVFKLDLATGQIRYVSIPGGGEVHSLGQRGDYVYGTTQIGTGTVFKIRKSDWSLMLSQPLGSPLGIHDDCVFNDQYMFNGRAELNRVLLSDLSRTGLTVPDNTDAFDGYGFLADGRLVAQRSKINRATGQAELYVIAPDFTYDYGIAVSGIPAEEITGLQMNEVFVIGEYTYLMGFANAEPPYIRWFRLRTADITVIR
jgi:hypothetical protein